MNAWLQITQRAVVGVLALFVVPSLWSQEPKKADPPKAKMVKSKLICKLPQDDATLQIEDKVTKTTGLLREFDTPELVAGEKYRYTMIAKWRPNNYTEITRTREVTFVAGDEIIVDLTKDPDGKDRAVIRFVPTPDDIVQEMIKLAKIGKDDVVFEPGCGDGRIVTASVKAGAKRGVGIDLDEDRVKESKETVKMAMLTDKVEIRKGDALDQPDYADASVVMLYMGDEFDLLIRPILCRDLKVGARIVSHRFTMGDWKPDETKKITGQDGDEYEVHLWIMTEDAKKKYAAPPKAK